MNQGIGLFHLHFYTKYCKNYEQFFISKMGFKLKGRFSQKEGMLNQDLTWEEIESQNISLRLIEIQKGAVNIVLMPAKFEEAKLEHFGLLLTRDKFEKAILKAHKLNLQVRENPHRTFISSKLGFRIEIHCIDDKSHFSEDIFNELFIKNLEFSIDRPDEFKQLLHELFGIQTSDNQFKIMDSTINLVEGKFSLKRFVLAGSDYCPPSSQDLEILKGLPLHAV